MKTTTTKKTFVTLIGMALCAFSLHAQNVGIGTPSPKAALDVSSTNSGLLIPRVTTAERGALTTGADQNGMQVYDTDTKSIWYYDHTPQPLGQKSKAMMENSLMERIQTMPCTTLEM